MIPTYQEASNIELVLERLSQHNPEVSVLVVDDNSPDRTAELVEKVSEVNPKVSLLRRPEKDGLGSAYRQGFRWGMGKGFDVLVEMDADLSHDPAVLPALLDAVNDGADLVVGSRYIPGGAIPGWPLRRVLLSRWGNRYATVVLGMGLRDATSGYRAYRRSALESFDLDSVRADGYGFQIEMAYRVGRAGGRIVEVPITFIDRTEGVSKMSSRIIVEALTLVTVWGLRDRVIGPVKRSVSGRRR